MQDLKNTHGWSTDPMDESDREEIFLPMKEIDSMQNSMISNNTSMNESGLLSSVSSKSSISNVPKHKYKHNIEPDPSSETTQFHIRVGSVAAILLHEDILMAGMEGYGLTRASIALMKSTAEEFFKNLLTFATSSLGAKDFDKMSKLFVDACHQSHIR